MDFNFGFAGEGSGTSGGGDDHFILNGGGFVSVALVEMAISFGMTTLESAGGSTDIRAYKPTSITEAVSTYTALATVNIASHTAGTTSHVATFDTASTEYAAGESIGITFESTTNLNGLIVTILLKKI